MNNKLYLVIVDLYENEENSIINICTSYEKAEELMNEYVENGKDLPEEIRLSYHIDEIEVDYSKDILWDCYNNSSFKEYRE